MQFLIDEPAHQQSSLTMVFAHGAGAGMDSEFMQSLAQGVAAQGIRVARFEFPYMARRRLDGKRRPPDTMPLLVEGFAQAIALQGGPEHCVAAGKSLGGRVASLLLAQAGCTAAVSLGYAFHPPAKPEQWRDSHWPQIAKPWLIVQGERDPFGTRPEVEPCGVPAHVHWLTDGDHDFKPRVRSGFNQRQLWQEAALRVAEFIKGQEQHGRK